MQLPELLEQPQMPLQPQLMVPFSLGSLCNLHEDLCTDKG